PDRPVDVLLARAREREHDRPADELRHPPDGVEVALRAGGEARLDHVDAEVVQLPRDCELLLHVHGRAWGLLPVAEGRVEDLHPVHRHLLSAVPGTPGATNRPARGPRNKKATSGWSRPWRPREVGRLGAPPTLP